MKVSNFKFPILLFVFFLLMDFFLGHTVEKMYFSENSKVNDPFIYSLTNSKDDIVIFGSSRAKHHYNAKMIEDSLLKATYNFGSGGQNIFYHEILLNNLIEFHTPRAIILELINIDFEKTPSQWDKDKLDVLLPFTFQSQAVDSVLGGIDSYHKYKKLSKLYPYNSQLYTILRNNYFPYNNHFNGFLPIEGDHWRKDIQVIDSSYTSIKYDLNKIAALNRFIELCISNNIEILIFISPSYVKYTRETPYERIICDLVKKYDIKVFDFTNSQYFIENNNFFKDPGHLNIIGAQEYTNHIIDTLKVNLNILNGDW